MRRHRQDRQVSSSAPHSTSKGRSHACSVSMTDGTEKRSACTARRVLKQASMLVLSHRILSVCNLNMAIFDPSLGMLALRLESDTRMNTVTIPVPYQPSQTRAERRCWVHGGSTLSGNARALKQPCEWAPRPMFITSRDGGPFHSMHPWRQRTDP